MVLICTSHTFLLFALSLLTSHQHFFSYFSLHWLQSLWVLAILESVPKKILTNRAMKVSIHTVSKINTYINYMEKKKKERKTERKRTGFFFFSCFFFFSLEINYFLLGPSSNKEIHIYRIHQSLQRLH